MAAHIRAKPDRETGGVLVGRATGEVITVTRASPPGPSAIHRPRYFSRDSAFLQRWLDGVCRATDGTDDYVGEWHVHLTLNAPPSPIDRRSLYRIARRSNYPTDKPLLIIAEVAAEVWQPRAWVFRAKPRRSVRELPLSGA